MTGFCISCQFDFWVECNEFVGGWIQAAQPKKTSKLTGIYSYFKLKNDLIFILKLPKFDSGVVSWSKGSFCCILTKKWLEKWQLCKKECNFYE